jgi:aldehyde dehydrogenase (NAD(P)+)
MVTQIDRDLETLTAAKAAWARLSVERKIAMLESLRRAVHAVAEEWALRASRAKGIQAGSSLEGEEWISGPWALLYAVNRYLRTMRAIALRGQSPVPRARLRPDGTCVIDVFPHDMYDRVLLMGYRAQVWMQPGVTPAAARAEAASFYRQSSPQGAVAAVLGAGNIASIAALDVLYKLYAEGAVCILKMNPVNEYLGPILERAFAPFVDAGYLRFAYGGADVGAYLCAHEAVEEIHITGSEASHNAIVAAAGRSKRITSELGNVSPTLVFPGEWTSRQLQLQAESIATQKAHNAGFNCIAAQVAILPKAWPLGDALLTSVREVFDRMEQRPEYYPGVPQRRGALAGSASPLRTILEIDAADVDNPALTNEAFCGVLICVRLPGSIEDYVRRATAFANDRLHGTLGANLVVDPATARQHAGLLDETIASLKYGCIAVNGWTGVGYFINETPWGAYPGHTIDEPGSGIGVVHNSYLLERTQKSVIYVPFTPFPKPPWFVTNGNAAKIGRALCDFEAARSPLQALRVARAALSA